jgi:transmembrane sensor
MLVAAAAWWMNEVGLDAPLTRADYATLPGQQLEVAMADGSLMTLNTGSSVTVKMTRRGRYVALHGGEVMFRVHPDADRPFVVESPALRAAALGTVFSVLELPRRKGVFVLDGRVKASLSGSTDHIVVEAGDAWLVESDGRGGFGVQLERGQAKKFLAWKEGGLIFDNTPLAEVVREIARYRKSSIAISDDSIAGIRLSAVFDTSDIEGLIAALPNVAPVTVVRGAGGMVRIDPRAGMGSSVSDRTTHPAIISR